MGNAVEALLFTALEKPTAAERTAFLDSACANDSELRRQVEKLLKAHAGVGDFLQKPVVEGLAMAQQPAEATQAFDASTDPRGAHPIRTQGEGASDDQDSALEFLQPSTRPDSLGRIGHYEVLQVLGKGGFGIVYRAFDDTLQRVVAVKVMAPQLAATSPARKRFLREARSSAAVRHENVVQVYDVGEQPLPYLVMEFIPGETLQQWLDRIGPLEPADVMRIGHQIAEGLAAAHATALIHRDIKPANILLEGGQLKAKISDFGLARAADDASLSGSGIIAGTPMYMAPEQARGEKLDERADLFSLGSVLYLMASGRPPFRANNTVAVLMRVVDDTPRDIREIIPETPQWLCDIISKLHAKNPAERFQSAREVADVLADYEAQLKVHANLKDSSRIPHRKVEQSGRRKWGAVVTAAVVLLPLIALAATELAGVTQLFQPPSTSDPNKPSGDPTPVVIAKKESPSPAKQDPVPKTPNDPTDAAAWERSVVAMPAEEQAQAVVARLKELNPKCQVRPVYDKGLLAELRISGEAAHLSPVRVSAGLKVLDCSFNKRGLSDLSPLKDLKLTELVLHTTNVTDLSLLKEMKPTLLNLHASPVSELSPLKDMPLTTLGFGRTSVTDLSPLKGLPLTSLDMTETLVKDLSPLKDMKLTSLFISGAAVNDLSPLKDMKLSTLQLTGTAVKDLSPLKGMPLKMLWLYDTGVTDLTPLKDMALEDIRLTPKNITLGLDILRDMKSLKTIGIGIFKGKVWPAAEFWARHANGEFGVMTRLFQGNPDPDPIKPGNDTTPNPLAKQETPAAALDRSSLPPTYKNSLGMEFAIVPKGKSWLGGGKDKQGDQEVVIPADFYLGKYEVTQEEWEKVMGENPSSFSRTGFRRDEVMDIPDGDLKRFPVDSVSWDDIQLFVAKLNNQEKQTGWVFRLPTQVEWEYSCRGGPMRDRLESAFDYYFADPTNVPSPGQLNFNQELNRPSKVGSYIPNRLGLFDMHGNLYEMCHDTVVADGGTWKVMRRGGSWWYSARSCRASGFFECKSSYRNNSMGFRLARVPSGAPSPDAKTPFTPIDDPGRVGFWTPTPAQQAWLDKASREPFPQRVATLQRKLLEENKLPVKLVFEPNDGPPTRCMVTDGGLQALWPLLALPSLTSLDLTGAGATDFTPLAHLPLTELVAHVIVDNVKSEAALKSMATLKTVNGRPAAEYWAERAALRREIDDMAVNAAALPMEGRQAWFRSMMMTLNPKWSGKSVGGLAKDKTSGWMTLSFILPPSDERVYDFSPLRALGVQAVHLARVNHLCDLSPLAKSKVQIFRYVEASGRLRDLSPLAGLPLKELDLTGAWNLTDLSPLAGMKLESFQLWHFSNVKDVKVLLDMPLTTLALPHVITDLRPFKTMKLTSLGCSATDLAPLVGMPLETLALRGSRPADLSPLAGLKLKQYTSIDFNGYWLWFRADYEPDEKTFRALPLVTINFVPAAKFWAAYDADRKALQEFVTATARMAPAEAVTAVNEAIKKNGRALEDSRIEDGAVVEVKVSSTLVGRIELNPLGPLKAFPRLKKITIVDNYHLHWPNLAPLMKLPIEEIVCAPATLAGNAIILRQMPTLKTINGQPAAKVLGDNK